MNYYSNLHLLDFPELKQDYSYDCGISSIQAVLIYYGSDVKKGEIVDIANDPDIPRDGIAPVGLKEIAKHFGLETVDGSFTVDDLKKHIENKWPTILLLQAWDGEYEPDEIDWENEWDDGHYVVAIGYNNLGIIFEDPAIAKRSFLTYEDLEKRWHSWGDAGDGPKQHQHYGIVVKGFSNYKSNDIVPME